MLVDETVLQTVNPIESKQSNDSFAAINPDLTALETALMIQKVAERYRFDWQNTDGVIAKLREEMDEIIEAKQSSSNSQQHLQEELGDFLFTAVSLARHLSVEPEVALQQANEKFQRRFKHLLNILSERSVSLEKASKAQLEYAWQTVKKSEKKTTAR